MADGTKSKTCPLCSRVVNISNASFNKLEGRRVCSSCSTKLNAVYPNRFSFKGVTIEEAKKAIKTYTQPNYTPTPVSEPKVPKKALCPKCHSQNIVPMGHKRKNISVGKAAGGAMLFGGIGLAAGFIGKTDKKVEFYCQDCGNIFKRK